MAETFTDSKGNVFPLNQFGRPQGYWDGNKFIFPQFGTTPAVSQPVVDPVSPVVPVAQNTYRLPSSVVEEQQGGNAGYYNPFTSQEGSVPQGQKTNLASQAQDSANYNLNISPQKGALLGSLAGRMFGGPLGSIAGSAVGSYAGGRGARGIGGDIVGSLLGTALLGPVGGLLGIVGGRMGDVGDMENVLNMGPSGQRGFFSTLGYGFGLGDSLEDQMSDYYGINRAGVDPFGAGVGHRSGLPVDPMDDIGDIDPNSGVYGISTDRITEVDSFETIANAFGGDDPDDGSMDSSSVSWT